MVSLDMVTPEGIYGKMFIWIVDKIDLCIYQQSKETRAKRLSIGLLDIFGFERFEINRYVCKVM